MALPFFFAGAKVAITLSVIGAVVGEFVGSDKGLGYVILSATSYWKTELAFSAMILLSAMAIVLFGAVSLVERAVCPWLAPEGGGVSQEYASPGLGASGERPALEHRAGIVESYRRHADPLTAERCQRRAGIAASIREGETRRWAGSGRVRDQELA